jgi:transcriptional regulator GlxA family with amidase domain
VSARRVVIVAFEGVQPLDVVGPAEVFHTAGRIQPPGYRVETVAPDPGPLVASSVKLQADRGITACRGAIDTLVVAGGPECVADHLDGDLSVPALARRACMSERNFARALRREVGMTPAAYVEAA